MIVFVAHYNFVCYIESGIVTKLQSYSLGSVCLTGAPTFSMSVYRRVI
jgi:hypothetical protein